MPRFMDEALARALYKRGRPGDQSSMPLTYGREFFEVDDPNDSLRSWFTTRVEQVSARGVVANASVLVVGSAFGYLMETLVDAGVANTWGIEPGSWFWDPANDAEWADGMKVRTANDWIGSGTEVASLNSIGVSGQARFNFVIDEDAAPAHSDAELPAFIAGLEARLQGNQRARIIHVVSTSQITGVGGDSSQNWKTLADWEAIAPSHTWIDMRMLP